MKPGFMKKQRLSFLVFLLFPLLAFLSGGCFKRLPDKHEVYFNDFEKGSQAKLTVYDRNGVVDSSKIASFNNNKVFGFFNNNRIELNLDNLPEHNTLKVEFDLLIHDAWDGNYIRPGSTIPDVWQMEFGSDLVYQTTFSNTNHPQSFPVNYDNGVTSNPPGANAWNRSLPGVCALQSSANGSSLYKIEFLTGHSGGAIKISCNDALQPFMSYCNKSWSIDNLRITAIKFN